MTFTRHLAKLSTVTLLLNITLACSDESFFSETELPPLYPQEEEEAEQHNNQKEKDLPPTEAEQQAHPADTNDSQQNQPSQQALNTKEANEQPESTEAAKTDTPDTSDSNDLQNRTINNLTLLGDSIGVGMMSDSERGHLVFSDDILSKIAFDLLYGVFKIENYDTYYKANGYNPFTSQKIQSLAVNLGIPATEAKNLSVSGSRIYQINDQISLMKPSDLIVLEVGSNDICARDHQLDSFLKEYEEVLVKLKGMENNPSIVLIPAFPVHKLHEFVDKNLFDNLAGFGNPPTCRNSYALMCGALLSSTKAAMHERYQAVNQGIESLVNKLDPSGKQLILGPNLDSLAMSPDYLAMDCFHPNQTFNELYSQMLWKELKGFLAP